MFARRTIAAGVAILLSTVAVPWAQTSEETLERFKTAVANLGTCKSIPYPDLQEDCEDQGPPMHEWCDGKMGPVSVQKGVTATLKKNLENETRRRQELLQKKSEIESAISQSSSEQEKAVLTTQRDSTDDAIDAAEDAIEKAEDALEQREELVDAAIATINKCIDYRRAIMNVFAFAIDKVRNENDEQIQPLARTLRDAYEESKRGHEIAIQDKENALATCREEEL